VTYIGNSAFAGCTDLTSIVVESGNKFYDSRNNCNAIIETAANTLVCGCKDTTIPNSVTGIGESAFYGCSSLTSVTIPNSVTSIGEEAFYGCSGLTSITIPDCVTCIGEWAFYGCKSLTSVTIPDGVTSIKWCTFYDCDSLTSVTIPNSVTSIENGAFHGCKSLTSVTIPNSVTSIGEWAFFSCGLDSIICDIEVPLSIKTEVFESVDNSKCVLFVPNGCVDAYKAADVWNEFADIQDMEVLAISDVVISDDADNDSETIYNLRGEKVDNTYRGIVIKNGKKIIR